MKVLVIDDEPDVRLVVRKSLQRIGGMTVIEAAGGLEGAHKARQEQPDAILLDMMMPELDGAATFRLLRSSPDSAAIPIVFLTAKTTKADLDRLRTLGAKGVVLKPFNPLTLSAELRDILNGHE